MEILTPNPADEAHSGSVREQASPITIQRECGCHYALDLIQVPGFPSAIRVFALTHSRRIVVQR